MALQQIIGTKLGSMLMGPCDEPPWTFFGEYNKLYSSINFIKADEVWNQICALFAFLANTKTPVCMWCVLC
jgi:hypothetical protein